MAKLSNDMRLLTHGGRDYVLVPCEPPRCHMCCFHTRVRCRYRDTELPMVCDFALSHGKNPNGYWKPAEK